MQTTRHLLTQRVAQLSPEKRALLDKRRRGVGATPAPLATITPSGASGRTPLSFAQERFWFLDQLDPGTPAYNIAEAFRLTGTLNLDVLNRSIDEIARRHDAMRTTFPTIDGTPAQVVAPAVPQSLPLVDLRQLAPAEQEREVERLAAGEAAYAFDLQRGPLWRAIVVRLAPDEHVVLLTLHHIIVDGWSFGVLTHELAALYNAYVDGQPSPLPPLPIQYADFARWQRDVEQSTAFEPQLAYWKRQLTGVEALELQTDRPRGGNQAARRVWQPFELSEPVSEALKELSQREGVTLFMTLLAAFKVLLYRYTNQTDIVVGSLIANRNRPEIEPLLGVFINMVPLRTDLRGTPSFRELLGRVQTVALAAFAHQDVPIEVLADVLEPERAAQRTLPFQVLFVLQNSPQPSLGLTGLIVTPLPVEKWSTQFDLTLELVDAGPKLHGALEYNTDLFDCVTIERLLQHFRRVLEAVVEQPNLPIVDMPLLSEAEQQWLQAVGRAPIVSYDQHRCVHHLFEAQAARTPDALAVLAADAQLTYRDLDRRANQLAHYLRENGIAPGDLVALCMERGADVLVALLGILKSGAAYVPLDPTYPAERLAFMLGDTAASIVLTHTRHLARLPDTPATIICLDRDWPRIDLMADGPPPLPMTSTATAYVIYTSGSTGMPKGVLIPHRSIVSHCLAFGAACRFGTGDRVLQFSALTFDTSIEEMLPPLISGATVVPRGAELWDASAFAQHLHDFAITAVDLPTAYWNLLAQEWAHAAAPLPANSLRFVMVGGEALTAGQLDLWQQTPLASIPLINSYGPTEATITATLADVPTQESVATRIPLGRPLPNRTVYVLDPQGRLAPVGVHGELHLGGDGLAHGYHQRPDLTAERFIPDPFSATPGARLYKTGDLVRYRGDGVLEFLGRIDHQVKVRGFRIELGEIEAVLDRHPAVRESMVIAREDTPGDKRIVAYVVHEPFSAASKDGEAQSGGTLAPQLRSFVQAQLPDYMVPAAFVLLPALPLTPTGKRDRRALPPPPALPPGDENAFVAPRTPAESTLAQLWATGLDLPRVGIYDNFFDLGGHSLLATQLIARIRETFAVDLPLRRLFEFPTVAALAEQLAAQAEAPAEDAAPEPERPSVTPDAARRHEPFPLTDLQEAYWVGQTDLYELGTVYGHSYQELDFDDLDLPRLQRAFQAIIARHDMLRAVVRSDGQQHILSSVPPYEIPVLDLRGHDAAYVEAQLAAAREHLAQHGPATDRWPLFDLRVHRLSDERIRLHFSISLLICDGWSFAIMLRELLQLYHEPALALPPLEFSYRDYVLALEAHADAAPARRARDYWQARLADLPPAPQLPLAQRPAAITTPRFVRRRGRLAPAAWQQFQAQAAHAGLSPTGALCAAYAEVLAAWSQAPAFTLTVLFADRHPLHPQVDQLLGNFSTTLLLEVQTRGDEAFVDGARRLQSQLWSDLDHSAYSGVQVARELGRHRGVTTEAVAPVVFASMLNTPTAQPSSMSAGLRVEPVFSSLQTPQVWLDQQVFEEEGALCFNWDAVDALFPPGLLDALFGAYQARLTTLATRPAAWQQPPDALIPPAQLARRAAVNATAGPLPTGLLHDPFLRQVQAHPDRTALLTPSLTLSYGDLHRRAQAVAAWLRAHDVAPNTLVAIVMDKGWEQVVAVLGVLQAGAAYLPLDPQLPPARLQTLLADAECSCALTQPRWAATLAWPAVVEHLVVDVTLTAAPSAAEVVSPARPSDLAYVIYTSGSTGQPKGVMIDHLGARNTVDDLNQRCAVGPDDRVLGLSALNFDLSVYDIFGPLAVGAALVLPAAAATRDPAHWRGLIAQHHVTLWNSVPALLDLLLTDLDSHLPPDAPAPALAALRLALLSGDWLPLSLPDRLRARVPGCEVLSLGGATEASIWSIGYLVGTVDPTWASIPYGYPLRNQTWHVLDEQLAVRPDWVVGELYIGGVGLAQGYWHDATKTAARFVTHPHTGERLYRTGDLGRAWPDGTIELLGRADFQVKVQGYRIELGEIEAVLRAVAGVREVVVAARREGEVARLVAYVVADETEPGALVARLQAAAAAQLPSYMLPWTYVPLERLPLSGNGKVDRGALPAPTMEAGGDGRGRYMAARDGLEAALVGLWEAEVVGRPVGVEDSFYELGGTSVGAVRLIGAIEGRWGRRLSVAELLQGATIAAQARQLRVEAPQLDEG